MAATKEYSRIRKDFIERESMKMLILGDAGIGKTTLIKTYLNMDCIPDDEGNVFEEYRLRVKYNGKEVDVGLYDLNPCPSAPVRRKCYPTDVDIILLCFSIENFETLKCVYNLWIHEVRAHYGRRLPVFLVGLRSDVRFIAYPLDLSHIRQEIRVVEESEGEAIHKKYRFEGDYLECSMHDRNSVVLVVNRAFFFAMKY